MTEIELWESEIAESNRYHHFENLSESINLLTESIAIDTRLLDTLDESTDITSLNEGILGSLKDKILKALGAIKKFFMGIIEKIKGFVSKSKKEMKEKEEKHEKEEKEAKEKLQKTVDNLEQNEDTKDLAKDIKDAMNSADASYKNIQTAFNIINNENKKTSDQLKDSSDSFMDIMMGRVQVGITEKIEKFLDDNKPIYELKFTELVVSQDTKSVADFVKNKNKGQLQRRLEYTTGRLHDIDDLLKDKDITSYFKDQKNEKMIKDLYELYLSHIENLSNRDIKVISNDISKMESLVSNLPEDDKESIECFNIGIKIFNNYREFTSKAIIEITKQSRILKKWLDIVE